MKLSQGRCCNRIFYFISNLGFSTIWGEIIIFPVCAVCPFHIQKNELNLQFLFADQKIFTLLPFSWQNDLCKITFCWQKCNEMYLVNKIKMRGLTKMHLVHSKGSMEPLILCFCLQSSEIGRRALKCKWNLIILSMLCSTMHPYAWVVSSVPMAANLLCSLKNVPLKSLACWRVSLF